MEGERINDEIFEEYGYNSSLVNLDLRARQAVGRPAVDFPLDMYEVTISSLIDLDLNINKVANR